MWQTSRTKRNPVCLEVAEAGLWQEGIRRGVGLSFTDPDEKAPNELSWKRGRNVKLF